MDIIWLFAKTLTIFGQTHYLASAHKLVRSHEPLQQCHQM